MVIQVDEKGTERTGGLTFPVMHKVDNVKLLMEIDSGVRSVAVRRFKESLIVNQIVQTLHRSANILYVCLHKNVLTIL